MSFEKGFAHRFSRKNSCILSLLPKYAEDENLVIFAVFPSLTEASLQMGFNLSNISAVCKGHRRSAGAFHGSI